MSFSRLNWGLVIGLVLAHGRRTASSVHTARGYAIARWARRRNSPNMAASTFKRQRLLWCCSRPGAVGGLAGGIETLGVHHRFMEGFAPGFGFDGVIAALLANGSPLGTIVTALFFGALRSGSLLLEVETTASREIITVDPGADHPQRVGAGRCSRAPRRQHGGERRWKF